VYIHSKSGRKDRDRIFHTKSIFIRFNILFSFAIHLPSYDECIFTLSSLSSETLYSYGFQRLSFNYLRPVYSGITEKKFFAHPYFQIFFSLLTKSFLLFFFLFFIIILC